MGSSGEVPPISIGFRWYQEKSPFLGFRGVRGTDHSGAEPSKPCRSAHRDQHQTLQRHTRGVWAFLSCVADSYSLAESVPQELWCKRCDFRLSSWKSHGFKTGHIYTTGFRYGGQAETRSFFLDTPTPVASLRRLGRVEFAIDRNVWTSPRWRVTAKRVTERLETRLVCTGSTTPCGFGSEPPAETPIGAEFWWVGLYSAGRHRRAE